MVLKGYAALLGILPLDLLKEAFRQSLLRATFHKLPPPGAFTRHVMEAFEQRQADLTLLQRHRERLATRTRLASRHSPRASPSLLAGPDGAPGRGIPVLPADREDDTASNVVRLDRTD